MTTQQLIEQATERIQRHNRQAAHYQNLAKTHAERANLHRRILASLLNIAPGPPTTNGSAPAAWPPK